MCDLRGLGAPTTSQPCLSQPLSLTLTPRMLPRLHPEPNVTDQGGLSPAGLSQKHSPKPQNLPWPCQKQPSTQETPGAEGNTCLQEATSFLQP